MSDMPQTAARTVANSLPIYRVWAGYRTAERLRTDMNDPLDRTWRFAGRVALDVGTDLVDGKLARFAGTTRLGGYLDQLADKAWFLQITRQLVKNQELAPRHLTIPTIRDLGMLGVRPIAQSFGLNSDAKLTGKTKMWLQAGAAIAACSPLSEEYPDFVYGMYEVASGASVVSGIETVTGYLSEITARHEDKPAVKLIAATVSDLGSLLETA